MGFRYQHRDDDGHKAATRKIFTPDAIAGRLYGISMIPDCTWPAAFVRQPHAARSGVHRLQSSLISALEKHRRDIAIYIFYRLTRFIS